MDRPKVPVGLRDPAALDPLIHSLRWHRDRIVARAWRSLWEWRKIHYGERPDFLEIAPFLRYDLLGNLAAVQSYAVAFRERDFTLFGIPVRVDPAASGFQWAPGRVRPSYTIIGAEYAPVFGESLLEPSGQPEDSPE